MMIVQEGRREERCVMKAKNGGGGGHLVGHCAYRSHRECIVGIQSKRPSEANIALRRPDHLHQLLIRNRVIQNF